MVLRIVGGVLGSVAGASAMSVYQIKDTKLWPGRWFDFGNYTRHIATPGGLVGALAGGFAGAYPDMLLNLITGDGSYDAHLR